MQAAPLARETTFTHVTLSVVTRIGTTVILPMAKRVKQAMARIVFRSRVERAFLKTAILQYRCAVLVIAAPICAAVAHGRRENGAPSLPPSNPTGLGFPADRDSGVVGVRPAKI